VHLACPMWQEIRIAICLSSNSSPVCKNQSSSIVFVICIAGLKLFPLRFFFFFFFFSFNFYIQPCTADEIHESGLSFPLFCLHFFLFTWLPIILILTLTRSTAFYNYGVLIVSIRFYIANWDLNDLDHAFITGSPSINEPGDVGRSIHLILQEVDIWVEFHYNYLVSSFHEF